MDTIGTSFFWVTLAQIMMINIVLSGDNAVVIAMASRALPPKQQRQAILFGSLGAIVLRVVLTFFAVVLLGLPYLKIIGAILLVWIGVKMLAAGDEEEELDGHSNMWAAIKTIIVADFIMSLDNVLGVAAAAKGNVLLLIIGLAVSIPLIIYGSTIILKLMNRFPIIVTLGGGILGWVAGEMLVTDPAIKPWVDTQAHLLHTVMPAVGLLLVVALGKLLAARSGEAEGADHAADAAAAETPPPGYHWVSRPWRVAADGSREYAAAIGEKSFRTLEPVSSHMHAHSPLELLGAQLHAADGAEASEPSGVDLLPPSTASAQVRG